MATRRCVALALFLTVCVSAHAEQTVNWADILKIEPIGAEAERQQLAVEDYRTLDLVVVDVEKNDFGLTKERVQTRTELKLRATHLVPRQNFAKQLWVNVSVVGAAFVVQVEFHRRVSWELPGNSKATQMVAVWSETTLGTHGHDASYVLNALDAKLEQFLNAYLKANQ